MKGILILYILFFIIWGVGEVKCIYKMCTCNWNPIGKAEILYTIGSFTPAGCVIGYLDIKDN